MPPVLLKSKILKSASVFLLLNVILFGFIILYTYSQKPKLEIELSADRPSHIVIYDTAWTKRLENRYQGFNKKQKIVFNIWPDTNINSIRIDFGTAPQKFEVYKITFIKHGIFRYVVPLNKVNTIYPRHNQIKTINLKDSVLYLETSGDDGYIVPDSRAFDDSVNRYFFPDINLLLVILLFEIIIIFCSLSRVRRRIHIGIDIITAGDLRSVQHIKENLLYSGFTAFISSLILSLIFPLQLYFQTQKYFYFPLWSFLSDCLILFFIVLLPVFLLLFLSRRILGFLPHILLLAILLYFTLETGILSYHLPELDGNLDNYTNGVRMLMDSTIALCLLLTPFFFYKVFRERIFLFGIVILVLSGILLFDIRTNKGNNSTVSIIPSTVPRQHVIQSLKFAEKQNVIVLIIDSISTEVVEAVLNDHPELKAKMPGFINFTNNVGMHLQTSVALPGIFSGEYFSDPTNLPLYFQKVYSSSSFIKNYLDLNSSTYVTLLLPDTSYTNSLVDKNKKQQGTTFLATFTVRMDGMFPWNIKEYYAFKITPYLYKKNILEKFIKRWGTERGSVHISDDVVYDKLGEALTDRSITSSLHVHHFVGGHPPFIIDANGTKIENPQSGYKGYYDRTHFEFKRLAGLLDKLRTRGIYDNAFIIILGDHSTFANKKLPAKNVSSSAFPALMVKNRNATEKFFHSNIPTSHSRIAILLKQVSSDNLTNTEIAQTLKCDNRLYREVADNQLSDWVIDQNYNVKFKQIEIVKDPLKIKPLNTNYTYKFKSFNNDNYPEFIVHNGNRTSGVGLDFFSASGELIFRLPKPNRKYTLYFHIIPFSITATVYSGEYHFMSKNLEIKHLFISDEHIALSDILTDDKGIVSIKIVPIDVNYGISFDSILVKEASR